MSPEDPRDKVLLETLWAIVAEDQVLHLPQNKRLFLPEAKFPSVNKKASEAATGEQNFVSAGAEDSCLLFIF